MLSEPDPSSSLSWNQHWEATGFPSAAAHASSDRGQFKTRVSEGLKSVDWCLGLLLARRGVEEVAACPPAGLAVGLSSVRQIASIPFALTRLLCVEALEFLTPGTWALPGIALAAALKIISPPCARAASPLIAEHRALSKAF